MLKKFLSTYFDGIETTLYTRGSTGVYVLFQALRDTDLGTQVIIPAICCETVAMAAYYAGLEPIIVDVDLDTLCIDYTAVSQKVSDKTAAILLVYIFGYPFDVEPFLALRDRYNLVLIEDIAQAVGGDYHSTRLGTLCDFTLLSFDHTKIIKGAAGALVERTGDFSKTIKAHRQALPPAPPPHLLSRKTASWRNFVHALFDLSRANEQLDISQQFHALLPHYQEMIVHAGSEKDPESIIAQFQRLPQEQTLRYEKYQLYHQRIDHELVRVIEFPPDAMCWRLPLVLHDLINAFHLTSQLRQNNILVSNHYFPLDKLIHNTSAPNSAHLSNRLLNLWVDHLAPLEQIEKTIDLINHYQPHVIDKD